MADWTLGAWVKNLTDEKYSHLKFNLVNLFGMLQVFKGEARQIGFDVRYGIYQIYTRPIRVYILK
jgi:iron complex outermembrane receptor protein